MPTIFNRADVTDGRAGFKNSLYYNRFNLVFDAASLEGL